MGHAAQSGDLCRSCSRLSKFALGTDNRFAGTLHIHAGLFQSKVTGTLTLTTTDKPYEVALQAVGHSAEGNLSGSGHIWLTAEAAQTMLHYDGEISVTGKFADAGTPYLQTVARSIVRQNLTELERHLQQGMSQGGCGGNGRYPCLTSPTAHINFLTGSVNGRSPWVRRAAALAQTLSALAATPGSPGCRIITGLKEN
ncbi:MAG: SRPBCC domain-containing protein [Chloroflexota bacterium]